MYQATHNLGGDHMRKLLIPMFLSISLVACNNTNTPENQKKLLRWLLMKMRK